MQKNSSLIMIIDKLFVSTKDNFYASFKSFRIDLKILRGVKSSQKWSKSGYN